MTSHMLGMCKSTPFLIAIMEYSKQFPDLPSGDAKARISSNSLVVQ
ncbi:hypothetical protein [Endozoicomonas lisbonensis]